MRPRKLLTLLTLVGLVLGAVVGHFVLYSGAVGGLGEHWTKDAGELVLIRPLTLLMVPLVLVAVTAAVASIGAPSKLGVVAGSTLLYFVTTMLLAVTLGTALVARMRPGAVDRQTAEHLMSTAAGSFAASGLRESIEAAGGASAASLGRSFRGLAERLVPANIVEEMGRGGTLGIIAFAVLLGLALAAGGETTAPARRFFEAASAALMHLANWASWLLPVGVFCLVASTVGNVGLHTLAGPALRYAGVVLGALAIHMFVVLPLILLVFARCNPVRFMFQMRRALVAAFGTGSTAATLPLTIESAETRGGCSKAAASFVLPLGSALKMDGTALHQAVAVVFLFQLYGIELQFSQLLVVVITALLAAIGAAGSAGAGLVMMAGVISAVNTSLGDPGRALPLEAIGVIIGVHRALDMCRTMVDVFGDAVGARIISRIV